MWVGQNTLWALNFFIGGGGRAPPPDLLFLRHWVAYWPYWPTDPCIEVHACSGGSGGGGGRGFNPPPEVFFCLSLYENSHGPGPYPPPLKNSGPEQPPPPPPEEFLDPPLAWIPWVDLGYLVLSCPILTQLSRYYLLISGCFNCHLGDL